MAVMGKSSFAFGATKSFSGEKSSGYAVSTAPRRTDLVRAAERLRNLHRERFLRFASSCSA
jgi:hypothetical protein